MITLDIGSRSLCARVISPSSFAMSHVPPCLLFPFSCSWPSVPSSTATLPPPATATPKQTPTPTRSSSCPSQKSRGTRRYSPSTSGTVTGRLAGALHSTGYEPKAFLCCLRHVSARTARSTRTPPTCSSVTGGKARSTAVGSVHTSWTWDGALVGDCEVGTKRSAPLGFAQRLWVQVFWPSVSLFFSKYKCSKEVL